MLFKYLARLFNRVAYNTLYRLSWGRKVAVIVRTYMSNSSTQYERRCALKIFEKKLYKLRNLSPPGAKSCGLRTLAAVSDAWDDARAPKKDSDCEGSGSVLGLYKRPNIPSPSTLRKITLLR